MDRRLSVVDSRQVERALRRTAQAFLLAAMKMHCYLRAVMARGPSAGGAAPAAAPQPAAASSSSGRSSSAEARVASLALRTIQMTLNYTLRLARSRVAAAAARYELPLRCEVPDRHVRWLGLSAFVAVLSRKQALYGSVLQVRVAGGLGEERNRRVPRTPCTGFCTPPWWARLT